MQHNIGQTIAQLRKSKGWTQAQLAAKLNLSDKTVSKWEMGLGLPSIEFFPKLAEIFSVTCDYLLTGKKSEVITSELELCVKNNHVERAVELARKRDDDGKNVFDYAVEYENIEIIEELFKIYSNSRCNNSYYDIFQLVSMDGWDSYIKTILRLIPLGLERLFVEKVHNAYDPSRHYTYDPNAIPNVRIVSYHNPFPKELRKVSDLDNYSELLNYLIDNYDSLKKETFKYYFGVDTDEGFVCWKQAYSYFVCIAYEKGNTALFKKLMKIYVEKVATSKVDGAVNVTPIIENVLPKIYEKDKKTSELILSLFDGKYHVGWSDSDKEKEVIRNFYINQEIELANRLNQPYKAFEEDEIHDLIIEGKKDLNAQERLEARCTYNGILWLDKALELCNATTLKKLLNKYPLTLFESLKEKVVNCDYVYFYRFAVDNGYDHFAQKCIKAVWAKEKAHLPKFVGFMNQEEIDYYVYGECAYNCLFGYTAVSDELLAKILKSNDKRIKDYYNEKFIDEYCKDNNITRQYYDMNFRRSRGRVHHLPGYYVPDVNTKDVVAKGYAEFEKFLEEFKTEVINNG